MSTRRVVTDFNETLVLERTLPQWCRDHMRLGPVGERVRAMALCGGCGVAAAIADRAGYEAVAASFGLRVMAGVAIADIERWASTRLTLNLRAEAALADLAREATSIELTVVSRGSPGVVVRAFLEKSRDRLPPVATVLAPELEVVAGRATGRLTSPAMAKAARARLLDAESIYLGDARDRRWVTRASGFRFVDLDVDR